jgi:hypothetical protein
MITAFTATRAGEATWLLEWATDLPADPVPSFRIYRDGELLSTTTATELLVQADVGESPIFEVLDDDEPDAPAAYPAYVTLAWYAAAGTDYYRIDRLISAVWTEQARVDDDDSGYFTWASGRLADNTTHQFRVVPVGTNGNDGTATSFAVLLVRYPDAPDVTYAYDSGTGFVTVAAA